MAAETAEYEVVTVQKFHLQIRGEETGRAKGDGRRGRILLEDPDCPYEVIRWLRSPKCRRASGTTGKKIFIWVNDDLLPDNGTADPNDAPADEPTALPTPRTPAEITFSLDIAGSYAKRIEAQVEALERNLAAARHTHETEIAALRTARAAEIAECDRQIAAARARVEAELARETSEMEALSERRRVMSEERSAIVADLQKDSEAAHEFRQSLVKSKTSTVETLIDGLPKIAAGITGTPFEGLAQGLTALLLKKAGVTIPGSE